MRLAAAEGNLEAFAQGVPDKKLAKNLYQAVRSGMGIKDEVPAQEGIRPEKPSKSSEELIAMGYAPDSDKVQRAREYEDWADDQRAKGKEIDEGDLVLDKMALLSYLRDRIYDWASKEEDIDKISDILKQIEGKTVKARDGKRYTISDEDIEEVLQQLRTEDAPPGREKQVKALKKKFDDEGAPYAIAWAQHNKHGKPKRKNRG